MKVLELTESSKVDTRVLKQCIETDPALTGKVLRVVNSSLYGLSREVSDLNQALALLGTKPLKLLVLGFSLPAGLFEGIVGDILLRYWRHTLVKAVAAREIAESFWGIAGDELFIAGLLQDLGALLLIQELGEPYVRFLEQISDHQTEAADLERQSLGFEHTELTARLLRHWRLPAALVDVVSLSAQPAANEPASLEVNRQILGLAEWVARLLADGQADALAHLLDEGRTACGMTQPALEELIAGLEEKVQQLADTLSVDLNGGTDYSEVLLAAHARMAQVAEDVVGELIASPTRHEGLKHPLEDVLADLSRAAANAPVPALRAEPSTPPVPPSMCPVAPVSQAAYPRESSVLTTDAPPRSAAFVATAAAACRQSRCPLSLMLVGMNNSESIALALGRQGFVQLRSQIESICRNVDHDERACLPYGEVGFLVILSNCERQTAVRLGQALIHSVRSQSSVAGLAAAANVSVGVASVALPSVNFDPQLMLDSADRCLRGARSSGGTMVKSIEIY